jgi:uncharacterized protein (DUF305 family)
MNKDEINKQSILYGLIGLLVGVLLAVFVATISVNNNNQTMMRMMGMNTNQNSTGTMSDSSMSMADMTNELKSKTGDEFDKAFLAEMIIHHQGAIDMANLVLQKSTRPELRSLANDIIAAQTKEINQMKTWQQQWGYPVSSGSDDSMGGMHMMH